MHAASRAQNGPTQQIAQMQTTNEGVSESIPSADDSEMSNRVTQLPMPAPESRESDAAKTLMAPAEPQTTNTPPNTNKVVINLRIKFLSLSEEGVQALRPAWASPSSGCGTLTADQLQFVNKALKRTGNFSMTDSRIIAFSGQQAMISAKSPVLAGDTNTSVDTIFAVTPYFSPESSTFKLSLMAAVRLPDDTSPTSDQQSIVKTNEVTLSPGQTAVLQEGFPSELFFSANGQEGNQLLVFVTPEIGAPGPDNPASTQPTGR
jgi:hypothetical protein